MAKAHAMYSTFTTGEVTERLSGRVDLAKYKDSLATLENGIVLPHGGIKRRGGLNYVADVKAVTTGSELVTNGTFASNITGWTDKKVGTGSSIAHATNLMNIVSVDTSNYGWAEQSITVVKGQRYILTFTIGTGAISVQVGTATGGEQIYSSTSMAVGDTIASTTLTNAGSSYETAPSIAFSGGGGSAAAATATVNAGGAVTAIAITNAGSGYTSAPTIAFSGGGGSGASATSTLALAVHTIEFTAITTAAFIGFKHFTGATHTLDTVTCKAGTQNAKVRLIPFEFSVEQPYMLEFGDLYIRVHKNNGQVYSAGKPVEIVTTYTTADLFDIQYAQSADTLYLAHKGRSPRKLTRTSDTAWTLTNISFTGSTFPSTFCAGSAGTGTDGNDQSPGAVTFYNQRVYWGGSNDDPQKIWGSTVAEFENMHQGSATATDSVEFTLVANEVNAIQWLAESTDMLCGTLGGEFTISGGIDDNITATNIKAVRQASFGSNKVTPLNVGNLLLFNQRAGRKVRELVYNFDVDGYLAPDITLLAEHVSASGITDMAYQQEEDSIVWAVTADGALIGCTYLRDQKVVAWHRHPVGGELTLVESVAVIPSANSLRDELWVTVKRRVNGITKRFVEYLNPDIFVDSGLTLDNPVTITGITAANPVVVTASSHGFVNGDLVDIKDVVGMDEVNGNRYKVADKTTHTFELTNQTTSADINGTSFTAYDSAGKARKGVTSITGLSHLEGSSVQIVGNGAVFPAATVTDGTVTTATEVSEAYVGLGYTTTIKPSRPEFGSPQGVTQSKPKRWNHIFVRLVNTLGITINGDQMPFRTSADLMNSPPASFTGDKKVMNLGFDKDGFIEIKQEQPLDMHVVAIGGDINTGEQFT